ncbi:MAG: site-2 protease family protein [Deltaproteobacteria bacterium]|nr:site-2 protease family protein [Deltaproteobacteria bacterium]
MDLSTVRDAVMVLVPMILCLSVHEYAHARVAYALGDDTAASMGRMNVNPLSHIDLLGTIVFPLISIFSGVPFFGWAKPVPVNPVNFTHRIRMRTGMLLTALAGPASNLVFAFGIAVVFKVVTMAGLSDLSLWEALLIPMLPPERGMPEVPPLAHLAGKAFMVNIGLAVFNFLPVPPLDGSRVLAGLLPDRLASRYEFLERNPVFVILAFAVLISFAGRYLVGPILGLMRILLVITGNA